MRTRGWVYQGGYIGVPPCCSPLAVLPGVSWRAGSAAVPTTSQALTGPREPAGTIGQHRAVPPPHAHSPQHSLVLRVQQWAGAGLAVLRCASSGIPVEARRTLVAEIPCRVVQAALWGTQQQGDGAGRCPQHPKHCTPPVALPTHRAEAALRVAGVRVAIALAELTVPQVQAAPGARVARSTVLWGRGRQCQCRGHI